MPATAVAARAAVPTGRSRRDLPLADLDLEGALYLVYAGALSRDSGVFEAVQGVRLALDEGVRARFTIVGDGPQQAALAELIRALDVARAVSLAPAASIQARLKLLGEAEVSVLPIAESGLPHALLDSLAAGVPVIAARSGAIADVVVEGVHGLLVKPRDPRDFCRAVRELAADRALLGRMRALCRRWWRPAGAPSLVMPSARA